MPIKLFCGVTTWDASKQNYITDKEMELPNKKFIIYGEDVSNRIEDYELQYLVTVDNDKVTNVELLEEGLYKEFKQEINSEYFLKKAKEKAQELIDGLIDGEEETIPVFLEESVEAELFAQGFDEAYLKYDKSNKR